MHSALQTSSNIQDILHKGPKKFDGIVWKCLKMGQPPNFMVNQCSSPGYFAWISHLTAFYGYTTMVHLPFRHNLTTWPAPSPAQRVELDVSSPLTIDSVKALAAIVGSWMPLAVSHNTHRYIYIYTRIYKYMCVYSYKDLIMVLYVCSTLGRRGFARISEPSWWASTC